MEWRMWTGYLAGGCRMRWGWASYGSGRCIIPFEKATGLLVLGVAGGPTLRSLIQDWAASWSRSSQGRWPPRLHLPILNFSIVNRKKSTWDTIILKGAFYTRKGTLIINRRWLWFFFSWTTVTLLRIYWQRFFF